VSPRLGALIHTSPSAVATRNGVRYTASVSSSSRPNGPFVKIEMNRTRRPPDARLGVLHRDGLKPTPGPSQAMDYLLSVTYNVYVTLNLSVFTPVEPSLGSLRYKSATLGQSTASQHLIQFFAEHDTLRMHRNLFRPRSCTIRLDSDSYHTDLRLRRRKWRTSAVLVPVVCGFL
jgi:hypothetical protein